MDIYEDYGNYIGEKEQLILKLKETSSEVLLCLSDCIKVLDYIYRKHMDKAKIDPDMEDIFDIGYGYLSNSLNEIKTYYEDYFDKDINMLNKYAHLIVYSILIDDIKGYLDGEEYLTPERKKTLDDDAYLIDKVMINKEEVTSDIKQRIECDISSVLPKVNTYRPVYSVFELIAEELELY